MAKDSPYFKFYVSEYNDGDIQLCSMEARGLFTSLCSLYWSREGQLLLSKAKKLFKVREKCWQELIDERAIKLNEDKISISFLDEQLSERNEVSVKNSLNGSKGGRPKKPTALIPVSEIKPNESNIEERREEDSKKREEEKRVDLPLDDEIFTEFLEKNFPSVDLRKAWAACHNYHSNGPSPPTELWQWKQKLQTWLDIESNKNNNRIKPQKVKKSISHL
jgi:uncharacterized protein YdaU (DUF1376 family)